jgi:hypothetical protein
MKLSFVDEESFKEAAGSLHFNNPPSDPDILTLRGVENSITPWERNGDICFDNSPNSLGRAVGSISMRPPQEMDEDIDILAA